MAITDEKMQLTSVYVPMPDGVRLAADIWLPAELASGDRLPAIFFVTRYWRSYGLVHDTMEVHPPYQTAAYLTAHGYAVVVVDGRGSGASFGVRKGEYSPQEIADIGPMLDWIASQPWSNGKVASMGTSYTGNTALIAAGACSPALKIVAANSVDFDAYSQLMCPGGVLNSWMKGSWGDMTAAMDRNDVQALMRMQDPPPPDEFVAILRGVRPADEDTDGALLAAAVAEHAGNYGVGLDTLDMSSRDATKLGEAMMHAASVYSYRDAIGKSRVPIYYRTGWQDAGTAEGAVCMFKSFSNPLRVMIGPWNHGMTSTADPYAPGDEAEPLPLSEKLHNLLSVIAPFVKEDARENPEMGVIEYYTLGEGKWKTTRQWPLPDTKPLRLYLSEGHRLSAAPQTDRTGQDIYPVDVDASTGAFNRWHTQMGQPVHHPDRRDADERLLCYDSLPLEGDTEVTGHPLLRLFIRSTTEDANLFAYLDDVAPDGRVRLITEGCLRASHRKVSGSTPPYWMPGPYHSFSRRDIERLVPGQVAELVFNLFPTSVLFRKGHQIRIAISGADKDTFAQIGGATPTLTVERNRRHGSVLELPVVPRMA